LVTKIRKGPKLPIDPHPSLGPNEDQMASEQKLVLVSDHVITLAQITGAETSCTI